MPKPHKSNTLVYNGKGVVIFRCCVVLTKTLIHCHTKPYTVIAKSSSAELLANASYYAMKHLQKFL